MKSLPRWATTLDVVAVLMALIAISVAIGGGFRIWIFDSRLSVTSWWRPALIALVAIAIRHALVRSQPLPQRVVRGVADWWRAADTRIVLPIHLVTRIGVLVVGFLAVILIGFPPEAASRWKIYSNDFLDLPARWDTGWYLSIATEGYQYFRGAGPNYQQNIAFFPAFPMAARYLSIFLGRQPLWTGVAISIVSFYLALIYFLRLARSLLKDEEQSKMAVTLLACYPFAVFFSAAYTEGLFLLTLMGAVYHFHNNQLGRAAMWGFVCGLTRPNGSLLSIVLALMAVAPMWDAVRRRPIVPPPQGWGVIIRRVLAAGSPGFGMLAFSAFIYRLTGNPFMWTIQNVAWGRTYRSLDSIVSDRVDFIATNGLYSYASTQTIDLFYSLAILLALVAVWPVYRRFGLAFAVFILITILPPMSAGGLLSMGRVTSVLFPVFLWLGAAVPARHRAAWIGLFALLQGFVAVMFFTWRPLY
ncbi:MAG TPA: mannosyltransferase family protein [Vicinamibacterales bacterium]|nr:mannosyltransferase family protein [Vicinamibacterales bacterium]